METDRRPWSREELILTLALYYQTSAKADSRSPVVIRHAQKIGRAPGAVDMKVGNFRSLDPHAKTGLKNHSKMDEVIWNEFSGNLPELAVQSFLIENKMQGGKDILLPEEPAEEPAREGGEVKRVTRQRVNQDFFRQIILAAYNANCCITGINVPQVLVASHIKPWKECAPKEKLSPRNGLCLNALHDRAFDRGLITVSAADYRIKVSGEIRRLDNDSVQKWLGKFDGRKIRLPEKFMPSAEFLDWHGRHVFRA